MFVALGVGAYGVAIFHVYTHAFFKACLFLGAGSVIHALRGEQDIRKMGGLARKIPVTFVHVRDRHRGDRRHSAARRLLLQGRDPLVRVREQPRRLAAPVGRGGGHRAADRVLHVPAAVAHVLRHVADGARGRAPRARVAAVDDGRAGRAGGAVGGRRLPRDPALPRAAAAAARDVPEALQHLETPLLVVVGRASPFAGLARPRASSAATGERAARAAPSASRRCTACSPASISSTKLYERAARPAAELDLRARLPALRRPHAARRHAERAGDARAAHRRRALAACRPAACTSTRCWCSRACVACLAWSFRHG